MFDFLEDFGNDTGMWFGDWSWHVGPLVFSATPSWTRNKYILANLLIPKFFYKKNDDTTRIKIISRWILKNPNHPCLQEQQERLEEILTKQEKE